LYSTSHLQVYRAELTDEWFHAFETIVLPQIDRSRIARDHRRKVEKIRVAILSTGIDDKHDEIRFALEKEKILDCRGFPETLNPRIDEDGYGTFAVSVLMRTAPNAALYVARIAGTMKEMDAINEHSTTVDVALI
jgi:hypothetical protein